jgi:hypothetical protein
LRAFARLPAARQKAVTQVRGTQPAAYLKILALLVPREMKVERIGGVKSMTDEELEQAVEVLQGMIDAKLSGENAKVIEGVPEPAALPAPSRKHKAQAWSAGQGFPPASRRAARERIARRRGRRGAGEAPGAIFEELRSAIFAAYAAIVEEDRSSAPSTIDSNPH